jgi:hypothetical protein
MLDPRLVQIPSKDQVFSHQWFRFLDERMKQNTYWTFSSGPLFFLAAVLYILYYSLDMPFGYYLAANWSFFTGCLSWYLYRKNPRGKAWKILSQEGASYPFSQVKAQLTQDLIPVRHSLFYGVIIGMALFLFYQGAAIANSLLLGETWLMLVLSLALGQASSFLHRYLYNKRIGSDLNLLEEIKAGMQGQHS